MVFFLRVSLIVGWRRRGGRRLPDNCLCLQLQYEGRASPSPSALTSNYSTSSSFMVLTFLLPWRLSPRTGPLLSLFLIEETPMTMNPPPRSIRIGGRTITLVGRRRLWRIINPSSYLFSTDSSGKIGGRRGGGGGENEDGSSGVLCSLLGGRIFCLCSLFLTPPPTPPPPFQIRVIEVIDKCD